MFKTTLAALALTVAAVGCGTDKKDDPATTTPTTTPTSTEPVTLAQAQVILTKSCVGAACHDKAKSGGATTDLTAVTADTFKNSNSKARLTANDMPQIGSAQASTFSAADKTTLLNYLNGK